MDTLRFRDVQFPGLVEELSAMLETTAPTGQLSVLAELLVDDTVRLIRSGSRNEVLSAGATLSRFLASGRGRTIKERAASIHSKLTGLLPLLTAASSPASKEGAALALRSWGGNAHAALKQLSLEGGEMQRSVLRARLGVTESYLSHLLSDLEAASLTERVGASGRRTVEIRLTSIGRKQLPLPARRPRLRSVSGARTPDLVQRLEVSVSELPGGPVERFRSPRAS